ncbi:MAG TPA: zinc-ribbon domain-containing protein, partial [bacterium]|nr:zinc-ribbon domain-containing protein [bacterium]
MIVCTKCGTENQEGIQFCRKCGGYLDWSGVKVAVQAGSAVTARLKTPDVTVEPGGQATCEVEVNNDGRLVDEYRLQVSGADPSWCSVEPPSIRLMPRTSGLARVLFRPPRASSPAAGTGPFVVIATSSADPAARAQAAGSLTIRPFAEVSATVTPQTSQSIGVADHTVSVENRGNTAMRVAVSAQDPDNRLTIEPSPAEITVDGGTVAGSHLSVRTTNPKEPRTGQRVGFQVSVRPTVGAPIKLDAATVLLQRPAGLWSKIRIPLAAALLLVIAGGVVAYAGPPYPHWPPLPNTPPTASPGPATPTSAGPAFDNITVSAPALD